MLGALVSVETFWLRNVPTAYFGTNGRVGHVFCVSPVDVLTSLTDGSLDISQRVQIRQSGKIWHGGVVDYITEMIRITKIANDTSRRRAHAIRWESNVGDTAETWIDLFSLI